MRRWWRIVHWPVCAAVIASIWIVVMVVEKV